MKITNLQCPSCGGKLEPMENNPKLVVCEYCKSQFMVEEDQTINYHIHQYAPPQPPFGQNTGNPPFSGNVLWGRLGMIVLVIAAIWVGALALIKSSDHPSADRAVSPTRAAGAADQAAPSQGERESAIPAVSPLYESVVTTIFDKPDMGSVTEEDLARIRYIMIAPGSETATVEYSFQDPYGGGPVEVITLTLEGQPWDGDNLRFFTGLKKLDMTHCRNVSSLKELTGLQGLICSGMEISQAAKLLEDPGRLTELSLDGVESLEGIGVFENLESLTVEDVSSPDLRQLASLKKLKVLSITEDADGDVFGTSESSGTLTDYSALSVLTNLESLQVESSAIRDLGFLKPLTGLTHLSLAETEAISIEPVGDLPGLTSLELTDNDSVLDYSPISRLTGLTSLTIDKSTSQDDPDLSGLSGLERLDMSGFISISFLRKMAYLKTLSLHGCNIDEIGALSGLTGLESLTCYSVWTYAAPLRDVKFIDNMPNLRFLDFSGVSQGNGWGGYQRNTEILGDISNVFNHQGLEELYLNNCMFELDFGKLNENPSLRKLEMREVNLKENFYVRSSGGMTDLWYDDVALDGNTEFLANYPNLEELYLDGNQLTHIQFAASLKKLTHLGINNNYVTELSPLNQAENLKFLDIRQNPISSTIEADEDMEILK